jgi:hypothetical protein
MAKSLRGQTMEEVAKTKGNFVKPPRIGQTMGIAHGELNML